MRRFKVKLKFRSPVHFGYKEKMYNLSEFIVHSDTLFGAIINSFCLLYGREKNDELTNKFLKGDPPFKISSAFLYVDEEYFIPKPADLSLTELLNDVKKDKKTRYIPIRLLYDFKNLNSENITVVSGHLIIGKGNKKLFESIERPRVVLDRILNASEIYYVTSVNFLDNTGLWFYIDFLEEDMMEDIKSSIRLLGDEGIGGERTYGFGLFKAEFIEEPIKKLEGQKYMTLSLVFPNREERSPDNLISYSLIERSGYIYSPCCVEFRRKKLRMFSEGSIFAREPKGTIVDVTPSGFNAHKVIRNGLAYVIPL